MFAIGNFFELMTPFTNISYKNKGKKVDPEDCKRFCDEKKDCSAVHYNILTQQCELWACLWPVPCPQTSLEKGWMAFYKGNGQLTLCSNKFVYDC